jgi:hypothetical protein
MIFIRVTSTRPRSVIRNAGMTGRARNDRAGDENISIVIHSRGGLCHIEG